MELIEERKRSYFNLYSHKYSFSFFFFFLRIIFYLVVCLQLKLWGFKINILARELLIDTRKRFNLVLHIVLLSFVQMDLYESAAVQLHADPLAHDLTWENQVLQDGVVHSGQSAAPGTFLLIFRTAFSSWLRQNSPLGDEDDVLPAELLLQLAHQAHLDFLERLQLRDGDEDNNRFPATANFDLLESKREERHRCS